MTTALLLAGALLAAAGTLAAAPAFLAAAVAAAVDGGPMAAATTWTAALACGLLLAGLPPRRLAVPAVGAIAVLAAASADNAALVLVPWAIGTAAALLSAAGGPRFWSVPGVGDRWAGWLLVSDIALAVAVVWTAARGGFVAWPSDLDAAGSCALLAAAALRAPLIGTAVGSGAGLLVVRTQVAVLLTVALTPATAGWLLTACVVGGAAVFAGAGLLTDGLRRDAVQETALVVLAVSVGSTGWGPPGWIWGALGAGTLTYSLRVMAEGRTLPSFASRTILGGAGLGLPFLPVVAALSLLPGAPPQAGAFVGTALVAGLALRARAVAVPRRRSSKAQVKLDVLAWAPAAVLVGAAVASFWGGGLSLPRGLAGSPVPTPPAWSVAVVLVAAAAGLRFAVVPATARRPAERESGSLRGVAVDVGARVGAVAGPRVGIAAAGVLVTVAIGTLVAGWVAGFL